MWLNLKGFFQNDQLLHFRLKVSKVSVFFIFFGRGESHLTLKHLYLLVCKWKLGHLQTLREPNIFNILCMTRCFRSYPESHIQCTVCKSQTWSSKHFVPLEIEKYAMIFIRKLKSMKTKRVDSDFFLTGMLPSKPGGT